MVHIDEAEVVTFDETTMVKKILVIHASGIWNVDQ